MRLNISSKSGSSISTPTVLDGAVRCKVAVSWKMGVENAEDAATWKATISMLRRQLILPLLEEVVARGEEGNISIVRILCVATQQLYSTGSVQEAGVKQPVA